VIDLVPAFLGATRDAASNLYLLVAFGGGIISFLSPCVLPIVPGYLSLVSGLTLGEIEEAQATQLKRIALMTALFVAGFTAVFVLLGLATTAISQSLFENQSTLTRISGGLVLLMAAYLAGSQLLTTPRLYQEFRFQPHLERFGPIAAPVAGVAFGLGWTPCIGPILGTVLGFAATGQELGRAALLLTAYSLGLGVSFLVVGLAFGRFAAPLGWVKRHSKALTLVSAAILAVFGLILLTDQLSTVTARIQDVMESLGLDSLVEIG
jgi:cytochrome c-type biogenesis protein